LSMITPNKEIHNSKKVIEDSIEEDIEDDIKMTYEKLMPHKMSLLQYFRIIAYYDYFFKNKCTNSTTL